MDGFKRPKQSSYEQRMAQQAPARPPQIVAAPVPQQPEPQVAALDALKPDVPDGEPVKKPRKTGKKIIIGLLILFGIVLLAAAATWLWYENQLKPADTNDNSEQKVQVVKGATLTYVANSLEKRGIINSSTAFQAYAHLSGKASSMKEGTCAVKKSQSSQEIMDILAKGCHDFKVVTFYPGGSLYDSKARPAGHDITSALKKAGFSDQQIEEALRANYSGPLFEGRPAGASLEGYAYGETYYVDTNATAQQVLQTAFDEMQKQITANGLLDDFAKHGLNLYEALTLASIVQREMGCQTATAECFEDQRKMAQVFYKRLSENAPLGSDVTFVYGADLMGVTPTVDLDSPYNTRIKAGLTPTPIASPGIGALKAVANPADTDYYFFVSGDDGKNYFTKTQAEHEQAIKDHCQVNCRLF